MDRTVVLVVGSGGREHALCMSLAASSLVSQVHCTPGNAGTAFLATNHSVSATDLQGVLDLAKSIGAELVVAGPEAPLCAG